MENITQQIGYTHKLFIHLVKKECDKLGISRTYRNIIMVLAKKGTLSQNELGDLVMLTKPTISITLKAMEQQGLIIRMPSPLDKRVINVSLTEEGIKMDNVIKSVFDRISDEIKQALDDAEITSLNLILNKINEKIAYLEVQDEEN